MSSHALLNIYVMYVTASCNILSVADQIDLIIFLNIITVYSMCAKMSNIFSKSEIISNFYL